MPPVMIALRALSVLFSQLRPGPVATSHQQTGNATPRRGAVALRTYMFLHSNLVVLATCQPCQVSRRTGRSIYIVSFSDGRHRTISPAAIRYKTVARQEYSAIEIKQAALCAKSVCETAKKTKL